MRPRKLSNAKACVNTVVRAFSADGGRIKVTDILGGDMSSLETWIKSLTHLQPGSIHSYLWHISTYFNFLGQLLLSCVYFCIFSYLPQLSLFYHR